MPTSKPVRPARARKPASSYHHGDLRAALLGAARKRLATSGPEALSLRELARDLNVSHNAPYRHFATREALLAALSADGFREMARRTREAFTAAAPADRMVARGIAYVRFALDEPALFRVMFSSVVRGRDYPELMEAAARSFLELREAVESSAAASAPPEATVAAWSLVHGLAHLLIDGQLPPQILGAAGVEQGIATILRSSRPAGGK